MIIPRYLKKQMSSELKPGKVFLLLGSRRVGKTFLLSEISEGIHGKVLMLNAEDAEHRRILEDITMSNYRRLLKGVFLLIIDEAQTLPGIGKMLKLMVDEVKDVRIIVTGSSSFDMLNRIGEPLTGRSRTFIMYPIAQLELSEIQGLTETYDHLSDRILYGSYPEVLQIQEEEERKIYLNDMVQHYLLKDILILDGIRNSSKMFDLLRMLAWQIGEEVSYHELANKLGLNKITIEKYLDLLTKVFVLFKVQAFSRNLRKEIVKGHKWYFYDTGIRNALINNFAPLAQRSDLGGLWENYWILERIKYNAAQKKLYNYYFWRTYDQQEIDFIEEKDGKLTAFEIKWQKENTHIPKVFAEAYPNHSFQGITRNNYLDFITEKP